MPKKFCPKKQWVESNIIIQICFVHVAAVSSTTTRKTDRQQFLEMATRKVQEF